MKIAILTEIINGHSGARAPLEIARGLNLLGNEVLLFAYNEKLEKKEQEKLKKEGVKIYKVPRSKIPLLKRILPNFPLFKILIKQKPQVTLFAGSFPFFISAKLARVPIVRIYMGTQFDAYLEKKLPGEKANIFERLVNLLGNLYTFIVELIILRLSNYVIAISDFCAKEVKILYKRKADVVIYLGADHLPLIKPQPTSHNREPLKLLSISRITPYKGFHLIIEGIKHFSGSQISLTIAGSSAKKNYLRFLRKIGEGSVHFVLNPSDVTLSKLYKDSDIYVTADRYLFFGFPIVEAALFSKPSVAFNFAAATELIEDGKTGFIVNNEVEFANCLEKLIKNKSLVQKFGRVAFKRAKKLFTWEAVAKEYLGYLEAISKSQS